MSAVVVLNLKRQQNQIPIFILFCLMYKCKHNLNALCGSFPPSVSEQDTVKTPCESQFVSTDPNFFVKMIIILSMLPHLHFKRLRAKSKMSCLVIM